MKQSIHEFAGQVNSEAIDTVEYTHNAIEEIEAINAEYKYMNVISKELAIRQAQQLAGKIKNGFQGKLSGVPLSVKDCICVEGVLSRAGSKALDNYKPLFSATAVRKCIEEGAIIVGKTAQDEFGFGSFSVNVGIGFDVPLNPHDKNRVCGGSSGGSAGITSKTKLMHASLGESTGGSIVAPSAFCGVAGLCPTYGRVSRYGLIDYGNSLDKIGPITKSVGDSAQILSVISGHDHLDSTSLNYSDFTMPEMADVAGMKIGIVTDFMGEGIDENIRKSIEELSSTLECQGAMLGKASLPVTAKYGIPSYYITAVCEASTNLAKYSGLRYGHSLPLKGDFNEYFAEVRSSAFGKEAKRRIMLGTFARMAGYRDAYYIKAAKVRTLIIKEYLRAFKDFDVLLCPTMPVLPPRFDEISKLSPLQNYLMDIMTVGPNIAGLPHLSVNCGTTNNGSHGLPIGALFTAPHMKEESLIKVGITADSVQ